MKKIYLLLFFLATLSYACLAQATLNLNLFLSCYYVGSGQMNPVLLDCANSNATPTMTDTITVELHDTLSPYTVLASTQCILMVSGSATCTFSNSVIGNSYYIGIRHKNAIETWSSAPVLMAATTSYDFTTAASKAYGNNMVHIDTSPNLYGFYQGDINQDGNIDQLDFPPLECAINQGLFGCYSTDLNGDGNVDLLDLPCLNSNICLGIYSHHP